MKIALCLSGQTRNWITTYESIKKQIIEKYNVDVFIHTWDVKGQMVPHHFVNNYDDNFDKIDYKFIDFYKPKKIQIDSPEYNTFKQKTYGGRFYNTLMMWYSIHKSNQLRKEYEIENNIKYDLIIRCRFDLFFENFVINEINTNIIYLPPNENIDNPFEPEMKQTLLDVGPKYMPNDQLAYGTSDSMDWYCKIFEIIYSDIYKYIQHPEGLLTEYLWDESNKEFKVEINNSILMKINR
jgi:hypothetical protein